MPRKDIVTEIESQTHISTRLTLAAILRGRGFKRVLLVTSAIHMPRSLGVFQRLCGDEFIPAPTDFRSWRSFRSRVSRACGAHPDAEPSGEFLGGDAMNTWAFCTIGLGDGCDGWRRDDGTRGRRDYGATGLRTTGLRDYGTTGRKIYERL